MERLGHPCSRLRSHICNCALCLSSVRRECSIDGLATLGLALRAMNIVRFALYAIFWVPLLVGIPVVIFALTKKQLWRRLPYEERRSCHFFGSNSRTSGAVVEGLLFFIAFCIKVYIDGNWNLPIPTSNLDHVVNSIVLILVWLAIIFGIPTSISLTWWMHSVMRKR